VQVLPLAVTMLVGPGIMAAVILITTPDPVRVSLAYVLGFTISTAAGVAVALGIASLTGIDFGDSGDTGSTGTIIQLVFVGLLIVASVVTFLRRASSEPPKWLGSLMDATPSKALKMGLLIVVIMPSDIVIMLTVGTNLKQSGSSYVDAIPFVALTALVAALPLLAYLVFRHPAQRAMPKIRDWMNDNSWAVNVITYCIFIVLILS
jgi:Sap, sulfolipid-1-addressing protein